MDSQLGYSAYRCVILVNLLLLLLWGGLSETLDVNHNQFALRLLLVAGKEFGFECIVPAVTEEPSSLSFGIPSISLQGSGFSR